MHVLQSFCIAMFLVLFGHNKTPKVFCLTFGVQFMEVLFCDPFVARTQDPSIKSAVLYQLS
jgi:hypothetical protein